MRRPTLRLLVGGALLLLTRAAPATPAGQYRLLLRADMLQSSSPLADFGGLVDEQLELGDPPAGKPTSGWKIGSQHNAKFPFAVTIDLGAATPLATLWLFDTHNIGDLKVQVGSPDAWREVATVTTNLYQAWRSLPLDVATRYLRIELLTPAAIVTELAVDAWSPAGWQARQQQLAAAAQQEADRQAALARAKEEALRRPLLELPPFGKLSLVDEVTAASAPAEQPAGASRVETILGSAARVVAPRPGEAAYVAYQLGRQKLLRPGGSYVLLLEYPEDGPRSMVVLNSGNESAQGFHTGLTVGDCLRAKYVNSLCESLDLPLSGRYERWTALFRLHDRFPRRGPLRGPEPRPGLPEEGFDVTLLTFAADQDPLSRGLAFRRLALYEVVDPEALAQPLRLPPPALPHRRIFWREEMADGVISGKTPETRGLVNELDWYRHKADLMRFLGINCYSKDLLEFGACQHWDPTKYGGNAWVHFDGRTKDLWGQIVKLMGGYGYEVLPYYEYSGSKGDQGLGYQKRCQPLTRDDAFTHITWVESANADVSDPDALADFCKMLDCTVLPFLDVARFPGVWLRTRSQLPVSFSEATRRRFGAAHGGPTPSREQLKADRALYDRYLEWWHEQRRAFFGGVRDYLRGKGLPDAFVLYTGVPGEPGVGWADWTPRLVTDSPASWSEVLARPEQKQRDQIVATPTPAEIAAQGLYRQALLAPGLNWGNWEVHHAQPADDPQRYQQTPGVMLSHAFNRSYTVADPATLELYRSPAGLTLLRHYALNEHMAYDAAGKDLCQYFVADIEAAGPYCMLAEALAVAHGDPTQLGYLTGANYSRGFPQYVRDFNANFLALPALPSTRLAAAAAAPLVVRAIDTGAGGVYLALVNTAARPLTAAQVKLPRPGKVRRLVSGEPLTVTGGTITVDLRPYQLLALGLDVPNGE
ncbi:MAG: hypothetical protein IT204_22710 [Fimbriimonadaceae bacterium]|nr:hypothetical protein [Fimbriimonadaceae bacterium]